MSAPALTRKALVRALGPAGLGSAAALCFVAIAWDAGPSSLPLAIAGLLVLSGLTGSALLLSGFLRKVDRDVAAILSYASRIGKGEASAPPPPVDRDDTIGELCRAIVSSLEELRSGVADLTNVQYFYGGGNHAGSLAPVANLRALLSLGYEGNDATDLNPLAAMPWS